MKILKCNYNWNDGTVHIIFRDGTKLTLLGKGIEIKRRGDDIFRCPIFYTFLTNQ